MIWTVAAATRTRLHKEKRSKVAGQDETGECAFVRCPHYTLLCGCHRSDQSPGPWLVLELIREFGSNLSACSSAKTLAFWVCLAPGNKIFGGKVLSSPKAILQLRGRPVAPGGNYDRVATPPSGLLSSPVIASWQSKGIHCHRLHHPARSRRYEERRDTGVVANLYRRAKAFGLTLAPMPAIEFPKSHRNI